ncbi:helix-turn-helix domain-containing protein [Bradyrhizobium vignae]|uniref:helix-turn-helix domain-containing protein n=1 Tax=Bradyrhizobium vignae TaxID=1549949 RepID=UPI00100AF544|nr:helix-turn-helix domain-containing protein [Bradyrhizobium vignae]RXG93243.1 helix-turn-helix domain-containing protein [Bradyrhizobium vignae]
MAKRGCPSDYLPKFADHATKLCRLGATDAEIAEFFGKDERTINRWKIDHPDFCQVLKDGKLLEAGFVEITFKLKHRELGEHQQECFVVGYVAAHELAVPRDPIAMPCEDASAISRYKIAH